MPTYTNPGVFVEELGRGANPIEGVSTSTAAFVGETERGPLRPRLVTSYDEYRRWFGGNFADDRFMPQAVHGFFENGGRRLYVARVIGKAASTAARMFGDFIVSAIGPGAWGRRIWVRIGDGTAADPQGNAGFSLKLAYWAELPADFRPYDPFDPANGLHPIRPQCQEAFDDLSVDPLSANFFEKRLADAVTQQPLSALAIMARSAGAGTKPQNTGDDGVFLDGGGADDPAPLGAGDFIGDIAGGRQELSGLHALELDLYGEVALVHAPRPNNVADDVARAVIDHCERMRFRFATIDGGLDDDPAALDPRTTLRDTAYAGFYAPWIGITDPQTGAQRTVPPGGHVTGVYARTDAERGVFKAPANEILRGVVDLRFDIRDRTQAIINPRGINAIRRFEGRGIRVWGARTLSSDGLWKYVQVRRLFIFLERSIQEGTQWVVFEPNDQTLWSRVEEAIRSFLFTQWRQGALLGNTADKAFFVRCDRTTMTQDDIVSGRLICEIGVAPVRPAEFVIFRVTQQIAEAHQP